MATVIGKGTNGVGMTVNPGPISRSTVQVPRRSNTQFWQDVHNTSQNISGSIGGSAAQWGAAGAGVGSVFGPVGTAIGGVVGGIGGAISGIFSKRKQKREAEEARARAIEEMKQAEWRQWARTLQLNKINHEQNSYQEQVRQMKAAGLSPGMMYGSTGASGGQSGGSAQAPGGAQAYGGLYGADAAMQQAGVAGGKLNIESMLALGQLDVMKSQAEKNRADAGLAEENSKTVDQSREATVQILSNSVLRGFFENVEKETGLTGSPDITTNGPTMIGKGKGFYSDPEVWNNPNRLVWKERMEALNKTMAQTDAENATAFLNTEKGKAVFNEMLSAIKNADANMMRAKAMELQVNFNTGEFTNWKTWVDVGMEAFQAILQAYLGIKNAGTAAMGVAQNGRHMEMMDNMPKGTQEIMEIFDKYGELMGGKQVTKSPY